MIKILKGMKDKYSIEAEKYEYIVEKAKEVFNKYGFKKVITPILEETDLFRRSVGDETDVVSKEMYDFVDKGGRNVSLRPEGTAGVVRAYLEAGFHKSDPLVKWYYNGPMYRYEAPQKGRYREFNQLGAEIFGVRSPLVDAELIAMAYEFLHEININGLEVEINTLGNIESRKKYIEELTKYLRSIYDNLSEDSKKRVEKNPLRVLDSKNKEDQELLIDAPKLINFLDDESIQYYEETKKYLELFGINYVENDKLVRGLDYYSDLVFEIKSSKLGAQSTVLGGGRYDKLLDILGNVEIPAIGFAMGIERAILLMNDEIVNKNDDTVFIVYFEETKEYFTEVLQKLRKQGLKVAFDYNPKSFSAQMKKANKNKARYVVIIGEDEREKREVTVKDFDTGEQKTVKLDELSLEFNN